MPLYEYQCEACGHRVEIIQKFSDPAPEACTACGKGPLRRLISTPAIQFKGTGWYITDYAGGRSSAASTASSSNEPSKSDSSSSGSDTGAAAKPKADAPAPAAKAETAPAAKKEKSG